MKPSFLALLFFSLALLWGAMTTPAAAQEPKPDDTVVLTLAAETWVSTKTARVVLAVEAAVTEHSAGSMRADMARAVSALAKGDWRVTSFSRAQDQTGLERWSATYEARVAENELSGLGDRAKKQGKAGMQLRVEQIDFSPTLEEIQAAYGQMRSQIYKGALEQLTALNAAITGRNYRIAAVEFSDDGAAPRPPHVSAMLARGKAALMRTMEAVTAPDAAAEPSMERSEKLTLTARVVLAALAPKL